MSKVLVAALLAAGLAVNPAQASRVLFDGHALKEACANGDLYYTYGKCAGYVIGAHDDYLLGRGDEADICFLLTEDNTPETLMDAVIAFLDDNPGRLFEPAPELVVGALRAAFPCSE